MISIIKYLQNISFVIVLFIIQRDLQSNLKPKRAVVHSWNFMGLTVFCHLLFLVQSDFQISLNGDFAI